jgi:sortase (surface protein transpeptidase)
MKKFNCQFTFNSLILSCIEILNHFLMAKAKKSTKKTVVNQSNTVKPTVPKPQSNKTVKKATSSTTKKPTPSVPQNSIPSSSVNKTKKTIIKDTPKESTKSTTAIKVQKVKKAPTSNKAEKATIFTQNFFAKYGKMMSKLSRE